MVGEVELCNRVKLKLLPKIVLFIEMCHYHRIQHQQQATASAIANKLLIWE
jgi:hypothetical protein